jgi:SAM-dependent methyltransferase
MIDKEQALTCIEKARRMRKGALYQPIILPHGVSLKIGHDKSFLLEHIFSSRVPSSFLDVGCNVGHLCYLVKSKGAGRVLGVEHDSEIFEVAATVGKAWDFDVCQSELETFKTREKFDTVALISVLHHRVVDPVKEIARYAKMATRAIILELPESTKPGIAVRAEHGHSYWKWLFNIQDAVDYLHTLGFFYVSSRKSPRKYHGGVDRYVVVGNRA